MCLPWLVVECCENPGDGLLTRGFEHGAADHQ